MIIFPAIDLKDGQCVRLVQGRKEDKTVYSDAPGQVAASFEQQGAGYLHVVDLDGAFEGGPRNIRAITEIAAAVRIPFQVGGGLRTRADVEKLLELGASRVIIGTRAVHSPAFMAELVGEYGPEKIVLGIDARDGQVALEGWVEKSDRDAFEFGQAMAQLGLKTAIYTDISRDGLLQGPNLAAIEKMARQSGLQVIASGGVSTVEDILALKELEPLGLTGAIVGKALYEGRISLAAALQAAR